jgi:hypothetical protein
VDTAYISALSALGGATIGGLASFGSSWLTQRTQLRFAHYEAIKAKRESLYAEFIDEATRPYGDALGHQKDDPANLVKIYALIGRIRLVSPDRSSQLLSRHWTESFRPTLGPIVPCTRCWTTFTGAGSISLLNSARPAERT